MLSHDKQDARQLRRLLDHFASEAEHNRSVMARCEQRELALLTADGLAQLLVRLTVGMQASFRLRQVQLALVDPYGVIRDLLASLGMIPEDVPGLRLIENLGALPRAFRDATQPRLEPWQQPQHGWLFDPGLGSVAVLPLRRSDGLVGFLGLGSTDPKRFIADYATDFLSRLATIAAVCLENAVNRERLRLTGLTDALTGLFNRRYLNQRLHEEVARALRHREPLACLFVDADHFKRINDIHGHAAGDRVLADLGRFLRQHLRSSDTATRYGGEEFALVLPQTDHANARQLAERIRAGVAARPIQLEDGEVIRVTVSIGVASLPENPSTNIETAAAALLEDADAAVYAAKRAGRDRVMAASELPSGPYP
jgi:diguanylate cyclase (GGDEF)-like protein